MIVAERFPDFELGKSINDRLERHNKIKKKMNLDLLFDNLTNPALLFSFLE
jgi:hypothetical protein